MKILAVDIGAGTQDIFLFDSRQEIENGFKMVLPSPTMIIRGQIQKATRQRCPIFLHGAIMGGGPNTWAIEDHLKTGLEVFATPQAAVTINDDLEEVKKLGIKIISNDENSNLPSQTISIKFQDFDFHTIEKTFALYGVKLGDLSAISVSAFDHGSAPPEISDRKFRFNYLKNRLQSESRLSALAYSSENIPAFMTRLHAIAHAAKTLSLPVIVMDSAPAAILGATFDPRFLKQLDNMVINIGNFHSLGFRLGQDRIDGLFEHHTGILNPQKLANVINEFAANTLTNQKIFEDHGHGALIKTNVPLNIHQPGFKIIVTGPRRKMIESTKLPYHYAVPFGDMMISGCFGLLAAVADQIPDFFDEITTSLKRVTDHNVTPWDLDSICSSG